MPPFPPVLAFWLLSQVAVLPEPMTATPLPQISPSMAGKIADHARVLHDQALGVVARGGAAGADDGDAVAARVGLRGR